MPSNHLILCHPFLLLPSIFPSIRVFSNESALRMRAKVLEFQHQSISFKINWLGLLAVQGTLKSLLQHHTSKVSVLQCSAFFIVQLSHPYMTIKMTIKKNGFNWATDAIELSHAQLSPSPPAFDLSHHQGLFQWVSSSHKVAKVLEFQLQDQSFQWIFRTDSL